MSMVRTRGSSPRLARLGIENSTDLGRHPWIVERPVAWLTGCRRPHRRHQRKPDHFPAFTAPAATLIRYRGLPHETACQEPWVRRGSSAPGSSCPCMPRHARA
ncbi:hypothetical protein GCM10010300_23370 [Streptomyces olivaceoviridis]|nr:hypothetical protein GCM10010300_23370 [Streptomyces olivaceoviridis]